MFGSWLPEGVRRAEELDDEVGEELVDGLVDELADRLGDELDDGLADGVGVGVGVGVGLATSTTVVRSLAPTPLGFSSLVAVAVLLTAWGVTSGATL